MWLVKWQREIAVVFTTFRPCTDRCKRRIQLPLLNTIVEYYVRFWILDFLQKIGRLSPRDSLAPCRLLHEIPLSVLNTLDPCYAQRS